MRDSQTYNLFRYNYNNNYRSKHRRKTRGCVPQEVANQWMFLLREHWIWMTSISGTNQISHIPIRHRGYLYQPQTPCKPNSSQLWDKQYLTCHLCSFSTL